MIAVYIQVITSAIPKSVGEKLIGLVTSREEIPDLLKVSFVLTQNRKHVFLCVGSMAIKDILCY